MCECERACVFLPPDPWLAVTLGRSLFGGVLHKQGMTAHVSMCVWLCVWLCVGVLNTTTACVCVCAHSVFGVVLWSVGERGHEHPAKGCKA